MELPSHPAVPTLPGPPAGNGEPDQEGAEMESEQTREAGGWDEEEVAAAAAAEGAAEGRDGLLGGGR